MGLMVIVRVALLESTTPSAALKVKLSEPFWFVLGV